MTPAIPKEFDGLNGKHGLSSYVSRPLEIYLVIITCYCLCRAGLT